MTPPPGTQVHFLNLSGNQSYRVPYGLLDPKSIVAIKHAIDSSMSELGALAPIEGTPFGVYVDETSWSYSTALFGIEAMPDPQASNHEVGTPLCLAALACRKRTAPFIWRRVANSHLSEVLNAPLWKTTASLPTMPHIMPWGCYHFSDAADALDDQSRQMLLHIVEQVSLFLIQMCFAHLPKPLPNDEITWEDWRDYPELRQWYE